MKKRFVWNFEIELDPSFQLPTQEQTDDDTHWESRFFWNETEVITLKGLDERFLELSQYKIKHRVDTYFLLPNKDFNLKIRDDVLTYKPLIQRTKFAICYEKKSKSESPSQLIGNKGETINPREGQALLVEKDALIYKFQSHSKTKFELARLQIENQIFFTFSVESPSQSIVENLTKHIIGEVESTDYMTFLQKFRNH